MTFCKEFRELILRDLNAGNSIRSVAKKFNLPPSTVNKMKHTEHDREKMKPGPSNILKNREKLKIKRASYDTKWYSNNGTKSPK